MSSRCRNLALVLSLGASVAFAQQQDCCVGLQEPAPANAKRILRVTADPNYVPFSNDKRQGFEYKIAELIAEEVGAQIQYSWRAQLCGFFRETLKEDPAFLLLATPSH